MTGLDPAIEQAVSQSFLAGVSRDVTAPILAQARVHAIHATRVFVDESKRRRCGLIMSGLARVFLVRGDGSQATVRRVGPGAAVGLRAATGDPRSLNVQAITEVEFLELDGELLVRLGRENATLAWDIAEEQDRQLRDTEAQLTRTAGSVSRRLAAALLDLSVEGEPMEVALSQEALADHIGASRDWVGEALRQLERQGLIRRGRGRIVIADAEQLLAVAHDPTADVPPPHRVQRC